MNRQNAAPKNYYQVLGLGPEAGIAEIKKAYRSRLKEKHPDLNPRAMGAEIDELVLAYRTLVDPELRKLYNRAHGVADSKGFDFRSFLREEGDDGSSARLIFYDLLHGFESDACAFYLEKIAVGFDLSRHFGREDYMDCAFILAEELYFRNYYQESFPLMVSCIRLELQKPYFKHFYPETLELLGLIIEGADNGGTDTTPMLEAVLELGLPGKETAEYLKKAALAAFKRNNVEKAWFYVQESRRMNRSIQGLQELERMLEKKRRETRRMW